MNWNHQTIRELERATIRQFMAGQRQYLRGRVLDFGAGRQPYRDLVEGEYVPLEKGERWPAGPFDAVMSNQVLQYVENPSSVLLNLRWMLAVGGHLVMTYPTSWDEVPGDDPDYWRFTKLGMELLLAQCGLRVIAHERRASVELGGFHFPLGYGVVACRD